MKEKLYHNPKFNRLLEIIPGFLVWATILVAIILSVFKPIWAVYIIIVFDLYWLIKVLYLFVHILISWRRYRRESKMDWLVELDKLKTSGGNDWKEYYHVIFFPTYKEPYEVVERAFENLLNVKYDRQNIIVALGGEEGDQENYQQIAEKIKQKYSSQFFKLIFTIHPKGITGHLPGKGSNCHYMAGEVKKVVDELKLDYDKIIVSNFDIDTQAHPQYFACVTYKFLTHPNPTHSSFQPLVLYNNNTWESPLFIRVTASSTTFWLLTDLARSEKLFTFSSHSMSWRALVDVGFWQPDIVSEDSRIFLQCLFKYHGDYEVTPIYTPVSMNTVYIGESWRQSAKDQYKQMRRWGWGVEHFPYMVNELFLSGKSQMPWTQRLYFTFIQSEGVYSWAVVPIIIFIMGRLPMWVATQRGETSAIFYNAPHLLEWLMMGAMIGLFAMAIFYFIMLPQRPKTHRWHYYPIMFLQWVLFPITMIIFGSIPSLDAQTRLMLGGKFRLGFNVTAKK